MTILQVFQVPSYLKQSNPHAARRRQPQDEESALGYFFGARGGGWGGCALQLGLPARSRPQDPAMSSCSTANSRLHTKP